ncbi:MAG: helix-turn-helix domain-containing protein [Flavobacteriales bacterium]|jgi:transcriptional regulator with XRE-family HTH domain|nr:helix-turn-helix domain-containing protein [Flavobacteriales bacterium]MCW8913486.1 helix-turn-helix domain-containing protein [Flavobacteriales bacterium]MCW8937319.1 helix-turn-helix domain-containing protein [Flavobacteriales bacterium]MCW8940231.1 helix-turn-helix domain-containing protein [Flavobacteriales bacterium]MCW8969047.1 helix-turn-helix domain-containing protein [Flavobacteriales bacterium]
MSVNNILKKIKLARVNKNYSQKDMAEKLTISVPTYSRFERGITKTNYDFLTKVCNLLGININHLNAAIDMDLVEDFLPVYETKSSKTPTTTGSISQKEIEVLIKLLEKQQEVNKLILEKLIHLKTKSI